MFDKIIEFDHSLFLAINGQHNSFFDFFFFWMSETLIWIPMYLIFIWMIYKKYPKTWWKILIILILTISITDRIGVIGFKDVFQRPRPSHNPNFAAVIHLVHGYRGGQYGFVSNHAANTFALATFLSLIFYKQYRWFPFFIFLWAALVGYSRIYLGVHYPTDVICGATLGLLISLCSVYILYKSKLIFPCC